MTDMAPKKTIVIGIVVTYYPDAKSLRKQVEILSTQCNKVLIVNNTPTDDNLVLQHLQEFGNCSVIDLGNNFGIAYAQNIGIQAAIETGADFVLIMDQDSIPEQNMVQKLLTGFNGENGLSVIAAGPTYTDPRTKLTSYFMVSRLGFPSRFKPNKKTNPNKPIEVGFLISSGTIISIPKLLQIGGMRSNYFIDHVDTEWCCRALSKGFTLLGISSAHMEHSLGDKVNRVWLFYLRSVSHHSPLRDYYMYRNTILMLRDVKISFFWKCFTLYRLLPFAVYFLAFTNNRMERARAMFLGLKHGLQNIRGQVDLESGSCTPVPSTPLDPS